MGNEETERELGFIKYFKVLNRDAPNVDRVTKSVGISLRLTLSRVVVVAGVISETTFGYMDGIRGRCAMGPNIGE